MVYLRIQCLFLPILAFLLSACRPDKHADSIIAEAQQILDSNPDSALVVLDDIKENKTDWPRSQQMRYELVYAQAQNKAFVNFTTDSIALELVDYYNQHGNSNDQMMAYYLLGCTYRDLGSAPKALESYRNAVEKSDTTDEECDLRLLLLIHSQMANVYGSIYAIEYEEASTNEALKLASKINDEKLMNRLEDRKCHILLSNNKFNECIQLTNSRRQSYIRCGEYYNANKICVFNVKAYLALEKYDSALFYIQHYVKIFKNDISKQIIIGGRDASSILMGKYHLAIGNPDSALYYYQKISIPNRQIGIRTNVYKGLSESYRMLSKPDSAYKYLAMHTQLMNELYDKTVAEASMNAKHLYDYSVEQKIAKQKSTEASITKIYLMLALSLIIVLLALLQHIRYRKLLAQKEVIDLRIAHNIAMNALRSADSQLNILKTQKNNIEKLLTEETIKSSLYNEELAQISNEISTKSGEINQLKRKIAHLEKLIEPNKHLDMQEQLLQSEAVYLFRKSLTAIGYNINNEHWSKLHYTINHLFPNFEKTINKDGKLSNTDMRLCMLVKAQFAPSEIEYIMKMKHSYASNARKRLHNSIFGYPGSGEEFDNKILFIK